MMGKLFVPTPVLARVDCPLLRVEATDSGVPRSGYRLTRGPYSLGFRRQGSRMVWNKPFPTITGGCYNPSKGRFLHPTANRATTLREAALLQSFPKTYRFPTHGKTKGAVYLMIGNALPHSFTKLHAAQVAISLTAAARVSGRAGK
jgi:DNA (cytosine-5)-methyltransferase 1